MFLCRMCALLLLTLLFGHGALAQKKLIERIPDALMRAELKSVNGGTIWLADYEGQITVLIRWQPWCNPCNQAAGELNKFEQEFSARGVRVVGLVTRDGETSAKAVARVTDNYKIAYRSVWINRLQTRAFGGHSVVPQILVVTEDGVVLKQLEGWDPQRTIPQLREAVELALGAMLEK